MSIICNECNKIFRTGVSPLSMGLAKPGLHQAVVASPEVPLPFNSDKFPHHQTVDSLFASDRLGCYICSILLKFLLSKFSVTQMQSYTNRSSYTTFEYHLKINAATRHSLHFDFVLACAQGWGVWFKALPARGLTYSQDLQDLSNNTGSETSWKQSLEWINGCISFHAKCRTVTESPPWFPTRLIDLGLTASGCLRLHDTCRSPPLSPYVTLSHCWGSAPTLKLNRSNLDAFLISLPEAMLPRTFRDAIQIARLLGMGYIWIDSLCIIQDSAQDWRRESSMMGRVYKNALLNIAATGSTDSQGGLFFDRDPHIVRSAVTISQWNDCPPSTYQISKLALWEDGVSEAVLNTRGWVLQERFLAPRTIHFGSNQIFWECLELQACETFPRGLPSTVRRHGQTLHGKELDFRSGGKELRPFWQQPSLPMFDGYRVWNQVVEIYSCTHLSKERDKLVAISALAKEARQGLNDDYLAGLWRRHLGWELGWTVYEGANITRPSEYRAPSWSWASIDGRIIPTDYGSNAHLFLKILDACITPLGDDDTGDVASGFARVQGPIYEVLLIPKYTPLTYDVFLSDKTSGREILREVMAEPFLDVQVANNKTAEKFYCLLHHSSDIDIWCEPGEDEDYYLLAILLEYNHSAKAYIRRGMLQLMQLKPGEKDNTDGEPLAQIQQGRSMTVN